MCDGCDWYYAVCHAVVRSAGSEWPKGHGGGLRVL